MARPPSIPRANSRHQVTARGNERNHDRFHFLELLDQVVERYDMPGSRLSAIGHVLSALYKVKALTQQQI